MTKSSRFPALVLAAVALVATAANARAQATGLSVQAPRGPRAAIESGAVATMAFTVANESKDTTVAAPTVIVPAGWRIVMSPAATVIAPGAREVWLVSVKAPASAAAGDYPIRLEAARPSVATAGPAPVAVPADSVVVSIAERHEVSLRALTTLSYVMGGEPYDAAFIIQNHGNVPARFDLVAKSTQGESARLGREVVALAPGQVDTIKARVLVPASVTTTVEEVLLVTAVDVAVDSVRADASLQSTVVPSARNVPTLWTVPAQVAIRTATPGSGVSAFTASGYGKLIENSDVMVDFSLRGPAGKASLFNEQEMYRLALRSHRGSLRLGDDAYGFSRLLSGGGRGTGAEVMTEVKGFTTGAYVQRDRLQADAPIEASAILASNARRPVSARLVALDRTSAGGSTRALAIGSNAVVAGTRLGVELAATDSARIAGASGRVNLNGDTRYFDYDVSAQHVNATFASAQPASTDYRAAVTGRRIGSAVLSANTSMHSSDPIAANAGFGQRLATTVVAANWMNGIGIEAEHFDRRDAGGYEPIMGRTETARLRSRFALGSFEGSVNAQAGSVVQADTASRTSVTVGGTLTAQIDDGEFVSLFGDFSNGRGLGESGNGSVSVGVNAQLSFAATSIRAMSFVTQSANGGRWASQNDLTIEQALARVTLALRARLTAAAGAPSQQAVFLEVKTPFGLPTSAVSPVGRARAEIIDAETGKGLAGALVRLGGQAAVTDADGFATFHDLKPGKYRPVVDGAAVAGRVVAGGGEVSIDAKSRKPAAFRLNLSRGAQILVRLRSFERTSATIANGGDTLTEVGALGQVVVAMVTPTDTLWQTSDERGRVDFGSVVPGRYTIAVPRYDAPDHMAFAKTEFVIEVGAGEQKQVEFKLVPEIRAVEFQGEAILIAVPAAAGKPAAAPSTITGKPQTTPITGKPDQSTIEPTTRTSAPVTAPARGQRNNQKNQRIEQQPQPGAR